MLPIKSIKILIIRFCQGLERFFSDIGSSPSPVSFLKEKETFSTGPSPWVV